MPDDLDQIRTAVIENGGEWRPNRVGVHLHKHVPPGTAYHMLAQLAAEGLLERRSPRGRVFYATGKARQLRDTTEPATPYGAATRAARVAYPDADPERLTAALDAYNHTLTEAGLLRPAPPADARQVLALAAQRLAEAAKVAGFPRYSGPRWQILLTRGAAGDVDLAYRKATAALTGGDEQTVRALADARTMLLRYHSQDQQGGEQR